MEYIDYLCTFICVKFKNETYNMSASKHKYSYAEAASIISNWLAESGDESESEVEDSDQIVQKMNKELFYA